MEASSRLQLSRVLRQDDSVPMDPEVRDPVVVAEPEIPNHGAHGFRSRATMELAAAERAPQSPARSPASATGRVK